jgi:hypothetical protein
MLDLLLYLYSFIVFVFGLGSGIWVMVFYYKKTVTIIAELKRNGETEIAEKIESVVSSQGRLPPISSFSRNKRLFLEAWREFRRADLSKKSKFLVKMQRLYRILTYISWIALAVFAIPFALFVIYVIVYFLMGG